MRRSANAPRGTVIVRLSRLARLRSELTRPRPAGARIRLIWRLETLGCPEARRPPADGQQQEQAPVALVAGSRAATLAPVHEQRAIVVVHPPLPTAAALGYSHFHHARQDTVQRGLFKAEPISLRTTAKGSLTPRHRRHRPLSANLLGRKMVNDEKRPCTWSGGYGGTVQTYRANPVNSRATIRYTSRLNGTTRSATRSSRSQRHESNSAGWPLRGVSGSISSSRPVNRSANHFWRWPRNR